MSIRWERFAGDTSAFAVRLAFLHDPDDDEHAAAGMAESWGALQIWVGGKNLCAHVDQGETLQYSHWYFLPLLDWLCANWDPLFHEGRPPAGKKAIRTSVDVSGMAAALTYLGPDDGERLLELERQYDWRRRHRLRSASYGGILPDVCLRRLRDQVEISWSAEPVAGAEDVHFLAPEGTAYADPVAVAEPLYAVLESAVGWLVGQAPESAQCSELLRAVADLRSPERVEARTAWVAALGDSLDGMAARWQRISERACSAFAEAGATAFDAVFRAPRQSDVVLSGSCSAALLFGSADPDIDDADAHVLAQRLLDGYEPSPTDGLRDFVLDEPLDPGRAPWQHGYDLAEELLDELDGDQTGEPTDIESFLSRHHVRMSEVDLSDTDLRAVSFVSEHHAPTILLNCRHASFERESTRRFTLAHELCHLLHDRSRGAQLAIASGPWAPLAVEQRANAFAAWLLMPPDSLRSAIARVAQPIRTRQGLAAAARTLGVSRTALREHLHNLGFIDEDERDRLRFDT